MVITPSQHPHPLVSHRRAPETKTETFWPRAARRLLVWNSGSCLSQRVCEMSRHQYWCSLAVPHIYWARAPGTHDTVAIHHLRHKSSSLSWPLIGQWITEVDSHWLLQYCLVTLVSGLTWVDHRNIILHTFAREHCIREKGWDWDNALSDYTLLHFWSTHIYLPLWSVLNDLQSCKLNEIRPKSQCIYWCHFYWARKKIIGR